MSFTIALGLSPFTTLAFDGLDDEEAAFRSDCFGFSLSVIDGLDDEERLLRFNVSDIDVWCLRGAEALAGEILPGFDCVVVEFRSHLALVKWQLSHATVLPVLA